MFKVSPKIKLITLVAFPLLFLSLALNSFPANAGFFDSLFGKKEKKEVVIKIGAILPLTGPAGHIGKWQQNGLDLAIEQINAKGGIKGKHISIKYEDSRGDPKTGVSAFEKLSFDEDIEVMFVSLSSVSSAILPLANRRNKVVMLLAVSLPGITDNSKWAFRFNLGSDDEAKAIAEHLDKAGLKKTAVAYINDDFGVGAVNVFQESHQSSGGKVVIQEAYEKAWTDFRTILTKFKAEKPDSIYIIGYVKASVLLIKQMRELGIREPVFANMALSVPSYIKLGGNALEGAVFTVTRFDPDSMEPKVHEFINEYNKQFGEPPTFFSAFAYDAAFVLQEAINKNGLHASQIKDGLLSIRGFEGVMGELEIKENGDTKYLTRIVKVQKGKVVAIGQ